MGGMLILCEILVELWMIQIFDRFQIVYLGSGCVLVGLVVLVCMQLGIRICWHGLLMLVMLLLFRMDLRDLLLGLAVFVRFECFQKFVRPL